MAIQQASAGPIDFERELNPAQRAAALAVDGAHLVIAGAGSGKTRTLVYRVANLVLQGVAPESILLLTFTRRAAREMLRRAESILDERCQRVAGGTFHSFANLVLRRRAELVGFAPGFTILDRADASDLVGVLRTEGGFDKGGRRFPRKDTLLDLFSKSVNTGRPLEDLVFERVPQFLDDVDDITTLEGRYTERKRTQQVMDYDDLLVHLRRLLTQEEAVRAELSATYRYVMVDEYQDTNRLQAHIAALLASGHGNLMVVGDDAQSIYSFRGASFKNIIDFPKLFPGAKPTLLEQNYRSTQPILDLGNAILDNAREKYSKKLFTEVPGEQKPVLVRSPDEASQAHFICERVLELREEGVPLAEIAVLCRAAWHSNALELELRSRNIPFRKFGGIKFVEAAHVKDVCALLKLGLNPLDAAAWFRILQVFEGIGPKTAQKIGSRIVEGSGDLAPLSEEALAKKRYREDLKALRAVVETLGREDLDVQALLEMATDYYRDLMPGKYDDAFRRVQDLEALATLAARYTRLEDFLTDVAIDPPELSRAGPQDAEDEWMTVSTVHSAKGLEWHTVFVIHLNQGHFPSGRSLDDEDAFEEERRLFYVAVTRAEQNLYLSRPEQVGRRGGFAGDLAEPSAFLEEVDLGRLVEERVYAPGEAEPAWKPGEASGDAALLDRIQSYFGDG